ncbi:eukaryotic translation initiation factor 4E binding protein [Gigaspora margarita]|uniref:Eukaryotic translation initiation factor 4E binding protein n=2 Tax=Gigaspora margarita TaxID=4874 RepID=A0A8H4EVP7_GIGMA|nr:eukaryotic translation initiation factor 4E binding protein [Gigaspora margarita]
MSIARDIPAIKKADPGSSLPPDYSTTPRGTIYSSTPGGSRIIYDRNTLLNLANSPLAKTPPTNLAYVPGVTIQHNSNNDNTTKPSNGTTAQVSGHLAPPQSTLPGVQKKVDDNGKIASGAESGDEDANQQQHDTMFAMDME